MPVQKQFPFILLSPNLRGAHINSPYVNSFVTLSLMGVLLCPLLAGQGSYSDCLFSWSIPLFICLSRPLACPGHFSETVSETIHNRLHISLKCSPNG